MDKKKTTTHFVPFTPCSLFGSIFMIFSYIKNPNGILCLHVFSFTTFFLKIKLLVKTVHRQLCSCFIHYQYKWRQFYCWIYTFTAFHSKQLVNSLKHVTNNTLMKINTCTKLVGNNYSNLSYRTVGLLYKILGVGGGGGVRLIIFITQ